MIKLCCVPALSVALSELRKIVKENQQSGKNTLIFCEDRLTLAAERAVCAAVGGTFSAAVYTFSRYLASFGGERGNVLSGQGSAMVIRKLIERNRENLSCFKKLSSPQAAQTVYDTIALLYSSRVSFDDIKAAQTDNVLLRRKLNDLALLYEEYFTYLEENGLQDRNFYLRALPEVINKSADVAASDVVLLGFQTFTCSTAECVTALMGRAKNVCGIFTGGAEDVYVNEALSGFLKCAQPFGGAVQVTEKGSLLPEAELLKSSLFNPEIFGGDKKLATDKVHIFEAADGEEELNFIAASIKKFVAEGERYRNISVMLPDVSGMKPLLKRVFTQYRIPYYVDAGEPLAGHFLCEFIISYLTCAADGCLPESVNAVISNYLFTAERAEKDNFRNYLLKFGNFRGGVKKQPDGEACLKFGYDYDAITKTRELFLNGLKLLPQKASGAEFGVAVEKLLKLFDAEERVSLLAAKYENDLPAEAALCNRAYGEVTAVLREAAGLCAEEKITASEFCKLLKSGFAADSVSIIPPKQDAVFVGDLSATANTGSEVVFAAGLTDAVPAVGSDSALLTDREITALESVNVVISPKISLVNMRARETAALNLCAFSRELYLSYPLTSGGAPCSPSEIIGYAREAFLTKGGNPISPLNMRRLEKSGRALPFYCSEKAPALKTLVSRGANEWAAPSVYAVLCKAGYKKEADAALNPGAKTRRITSGERLFVSGGTVSPTTLERYFACPYQGFMSQGLRVAEREVGSARPVDSGNFIHEVLQRAAKLTGEVTTCDEMKERAEKIAEDLLNEPQYKGMNADKCGQYAAKKLVDEAAEISAGMFEQIVNSGFTVEACENACETPLNGGLKLYGRCDRVDNCGDMVRIIDYKTGSVDASPEKYYMGLKLQLELYLLSASRGRRAVGAYYFPAKVEYSEKAGGAFRLKGFMDGGDDVVFATDTGAEPKKKSRYSEASLGGRQPDGVMKGEDFYDFLQYGAMVAKKGADEMISGYITPSPVESACSYCKMGGCCGFSEIYGGTVRAEKKVKCADVARVARAGRGE